MSRLRALLVLPLFFATIASARVVSYAPYSDQVSFSAQQRRTDRYFAAVEGPSSVYYGGAPLPGSAPLLGYSYGQLVVYDTKGQEEPRVVLPKDGSLASFNLMATRDVAGTATILVETNADIGGNSKHELLFLYSRDGGSSWKRLLMPSPLVAQTFNQDLGGPVSHQRQSPLRIGTDSFPFVVAVPNSGIYAIAVDGTPKLIVPTTPTNYALTLAGTDRDGTRFLVRTNSNALLITDLAGNVTQLGTTDPSTIDGWITPDGAAFVEQQRNDGRFLFLYANGTRTGIAGPYNTTPPVLGSPVLSFIDPISFYAEPTADYNGAWMIQRATGKPTTLSLYTRAGGLQQQWSDPDGPQVEAIIAGESGSTVLIQVHRQRPQADQRLFKDPALAVWHVGEPAPAQYDELYLNETDAKGFVHVDVDKLVLGEPFVFDSGVQFANIGVVISPSVPGGGADVTQEWGIVRGALTQKLVLPGIARTAGAYGSYWASDVILYNPLDTKQNVIIRYVPTGEGLSLLILREKTVTLEAHEIRVIPDVLKTLFLLDSGGGAFFLTPDVGINATSRTYTQAANGTYGFGMNAIDVYAAANPRFPVSFAGALQGLNFRTNLILTDVSGRGADTALAASGTSGLMGTSNVAFHSPVLGQQQINGISTVLGVVPSDTGALLVRPQSGETIASLFAIDNRTNDPTWFPPDLPAPFVRTIPAIGHLDGVNNAKFRSDLFLYNPSTQLRTVTLQMKLWDTNDLPQTISLSLLPNEARVIRDVLFTAFGKTGIGRIRYQSTAPDSVGVRVTSRTYSIDENGGTYGFLMPPLNNFQSAGPGDTLEILGAVGGKGFRTNVGIVEMASGFSTAPAATVNVEIYDQKGLKIDTFTVTVPSAGGIQVNDIFRSRNLGDGPAAAMIRLSPSSGMIGAYATVVDNGTNDPTYLAAQLGAKP
jgi:hypothetical protein